ncbi:MAG: hypothetical protein IK027_03445 [Deltaproteobacteria bacterium]|nr:hypothetical protein [Deltaproteobacteria bacterium]
MTSRFRSLGLALLGVLLGAAVWAAPQVVLDPQQSKIARFSMHVMQPSAVLQQLISPPLLNRLERLAPEPVKVVRALQAAPVSELALSGLVEEGEVVLAVRLPEAREQLARIASGDFTTDDVANLGGAELAAIIKPNSAGWQVTPNVAPGVHKLGKEVFIAASGDQLLLGDSQKAVETALQGALLSGGQILQIPDRQHDIWLRLEGQIGYALDGQETFVQEPAFQEFFVHRIPEGWRFAFNCQLPENVRSRIRMKALPPELLRFYGDREPFLFQAFNLDILNVLNMFRVKGEQPLDLKELLGGYAPEDFYGLAFAVGTPARIIGLEVPGLTVALNGRGQVLAEIMDTLVGTVGGSWTARQVPGWDDVRVSEMAGSLPLPATLLAARSGDMLVAGLMAPEALLQPGDAARLAPEQFRQAPGYFSYVGVQNLWQRLSRLLAPGSPLRTLSGLDGKLSPEMLQKLDRLLILQPPVKQLMAWNDGLSWTSAEGVLVEDPQQQEFMPALCDLMESIAAEQERKKATPQGP